MTLRWRWFCRSSTWTCRSRTHVQFIPHINILNWGSGVVIGFQTLVYPYLKPFTTWYNIYIYIYIHFLRFPNGWWLEDGLCASGTCLAAQSCTSKSSAAQSGGESTLTRGATWRSLLVDYPSIVDVGSYQGSLWYVGMCLMMMMMMIFGRFQQFVWRVINESMLSCLMCLDTIHKDKSHGFISSRSISLSRNLCVWMIG